MSKSKTITIVASAIIISALVFTGCQNRRHAGVHHDAVMHITKTLELNVNQQSKLQAVKQQIQDRGRKHCTSKGVIEDAIKKQVQSDSFDADILNKLIGKEFDRVESTVSSILAEVADFHSTLDSEQKEKLRELIR